MEIVELLEKAVWFGFAGLGFGILFNVPLRSLTIIWILAALGGLARNVLILIGVDAIIATLLGAGLIGMASIYAAHKKHAPPLVFSIPALIPMVPGVLGYRTMLGILRLTGSLEDSDSYSDILNQTINNGINTLLITLTLAAGAAIPLLATRKISAKNLKFKK